MEFQAIFPFPLLYSLSKFDMGREESGSTEEIYLKVCIV